MDKKVSILLFFLLNISTLFSQELCAPSQLEVEAGNRNLFFSWKDINDNSAENIIFEECFQICAPTGTITHLNDNGNGGWFRGTDGNFYCAQGFDCNLEDPGAGWSAIAWWTAEPGTEVDSRMVFGPFDISSDASTSLNFLEAYYWGEMLVDSNVVGYLLMMEIAGKHLHPTPLYSTIGQLFL